jgi:hypothetical protein
MDDIRETYDIPKKSSSPTFAFIGFVVVFAVGAPLLWLVLPDGAATVAGLAIFLLVIIAVALRTILGSRDVARPPGRNPVPTRPD